MNQLIEFKESINVKIEGRFAYFTKKIVKVFVLRSGKPSYVIDEDGSKYDFEYVEDKDLVYRTIVRNLMFKELI